MTRAVIVEEVEDLQAEYGDKKWGVMNARNLESNQAQNFLGSQGWEAVQFTPPDKHGECTMLWKRDAQAWRDKEERDWLRDSRIEEQRRKEEEDSS